MGGGYSTTLCDIPGKKIGINFIHSIETKISICKSCGFVYVNPSIRQEEWDEYYSDMYSGYQSHEDYSIDNRIELIKKYMMNDSRILEVGGNEQGRFSECLGKLFSEYLSFDINQNCHNNLDALKDSMNVEMIVSYYVFEHIVDINEMIDRCAKMLMENGIFIIEVPDANIYYRNASALNLHEHVNHFTPQSLSMLMGKHGFICLEVSRHFASRDFGFVAVFRKSGYEKDMTDAYVINQSLIMDGLFEIASRENNLNKTVERIYEMNDANNLKDVLFWCANDVLTMILDKYEEKFGVFEATIIDEDTKKRDYYGEKYSVNTSYEIFGNDKRRDFKKVVICSFIRTDSICNILRKYSREDIDVLVVGKSLELVERGI